MTDDNSRLQAAGDPEPGMPRWVKVSALVALILVVIMVIVMLVSGGEHGPTRHSLGGASGSAAAHDA